MNRLTDNDRRFGPITVARWKKTFSAYFETGDEEDGNYRNYLLIVAFGWAIRIALPNMIPPWRIRHEANWDQETVTRLGRNHYFETHSRQFGVSLSDMGNGYDFLQIFFGAQTHDSSTTKSWSKHLPWKQWNHVRHSVYTPNGDHFYTEQRGADFREYFGKKEECPKVHFGFDDYDGKRITATCTIEEREWHKGAGWFKWLRYFYPAKIRRSLDLHFSEEVGPEKGSWKGGTIGHGIDMLLGETPEQAFIRYCQLDHTARGAKKFNIRFVGQCNAPQPGKMVEA